MRSQDAEVSVDNLIPPPLMMSPPEKVEVAEPVIAKLEVVALVPKRLATVIAVDDAYAIWEVEDAWSPALNQIGVEVELASAPKLVVGVHAKLALLQPEQEETVMEPKFAPPNALSTPAMVEDAETERLVVVAPAAVSPPLNAIWVVVALERNG